MSGMVKTFDFITDQLPFGYAFNFENYLFNKIKHINTQGIPERADYFIVNNIKKRIEGKIHFLIKDGKAYSPWQSLFGSFEFSPRLHPNILKDFWQHIEQDLKARQINEVNITHHAGCYAPIKASNAHKALESSGFSIKLEAINHHIDIDENPLQSRMHEMEVRRLKKCESNGFEYRQEDLNSSIEIYDFIEQCRKDQGLSVSISKEKFKTYLDQFPQSYQLFSIRDGSKLIAATVAVQVCRRILYNFLPASLAEYNSFSPMVMLLEGMYRHCQERNYELLDLGISTEKDGAHQDSLIAFKEHMGGVASYKYSYQKNLEV